LSAAAAFPHNPLTMKAHDVQILEAGLARSLPLAANGGTFGDERA
jgi:hypothetical protein